MKSIHLKKSGFTLIECLVSLSVVSFCILMIAPCIKVITRVNLDDRISDDALAIKQLRLLFVQLEDIEVDGDGLHFIYRDQEGELIYDKGRIVKTPGYEIFMENIKEGRFYEEGGEIWLAWTRNKHQKKALLGCIE